MTGFEALGALVAGFAGFVAGAVWYAPFTFGPLWLRFAPQALDRMEHTLSHRFAHYAVALLAGWVQAFALAIILEFCKRQDLGFTLVMAVLVWFGFSASTSLMDGIFRRRLAQDWMIDMGHRLLVLLVIALVLGLWPSP